MDSIELNRIYGLLCQIDANVSKRALEYTIEQAEQVGHKSYAIRISRNKNPETYPTVIVKDGVGSVYSEYDKAKDKILNDNLTVYSIAG